MIIAVMAIDEMINGKSESRKLKKSSRMINYFREMRRVLKPQGVLLMVIDASKFLLVHHYCHDFVS
jgi:hypothetical protein